MKKLLTQFRYISLLLISIASFPYQSASAVNIGEEITYTLTAKNAGTTVASNVKASDVLADHVKFISGDSGITMRTIHGIEYVFANFSSIPIGESASKSFIVKVVETPIGDTQFCNRATVNSGNYSQNSNLVCHDIGDTTSNDIEIKKLSLPLPKSKGDGKLSTNQVFTYAIGIKNTHTEAFNNILITDVLDSHLEFVSQRGDPSIINNGQSITISIDNLGIGENIIKYFDVKVKGDTVNGTEICNEANVHSNNKSGRSELICHDVIKSQSPILKFTKSANIIGDISIDGQCGLTTNTCVQGSLSTISDGKWSCLGHGSYGTDSICSISTPISNDSCFWDDASDTPNTIDNNCYFQ